jgi:hypothetical protein
VAAELVAELLLLAALMPLVGAPVVAPPTEMLSGVHPDHRQKRAGGDTLLTGCANSRQSRIKDDASYGV